MDFLSPEALRGALTAGLDGTALAELRSLMSGTGLTDADRPIRIRLASAQRELNQALLVQRIDIREALCEGLQGEITCVSLRAGLPLKAFEGLPVEIQLVTDRGQLRPICAVVRGARAGQSDQGLATYQLEIADVLTLFEMQRNTRHFYDKSVVEITETILAEWRQNNLIARAFEFDLSLLDRSRYPKRAFTRQHNITTRAFLERIWRQNGFFWFIRPGRANPQDGQPEDDTPVHTLVLCDDATKLPRNAAGTVQYQGNAGTQERDTVSLWSAHHTLVPGATRDQSWDYQATGAQRMAQTTHPGVLDQGESGNLLAAILEDAWIDTPHAGDSRDHFERLGSLRIQHHEYRHQCYEALADIRDLAVGQWNPLAGHPDFDALPEDQRQFVVTHLRHRGENNLPKTLNERAQALLANTGWAQKDNHAKEDQRYTCRFTAVPRGRPIVPEWNEARYFPRADPLTAIVVGPLGEEVHCDEQGRIKVQIQGLRPEDHAHAQGAGTTGTDADSAWVRVVSPWAGDQRGALTLPRAGDELILFFLGGDPDKPIAINAAYSAQNRPPRFSQVGALPGNRYLSGIHSREVHGNRYNQLRIDDTPGEISAQLESQHGSSQLNLGHLTHPRIDGKGDPRGEGAELRTDQAAALRGGQGVLLSAEEQPRASGTLLARDGLIQELHAAQSVQGKAAELADTHTAGETERAPLQELTDRVVHWDEGTNANAPDAPPSKDARQPLIGLSAPAGLVATTTQNAVLSAGGTLDLVSGTHTQLSAGRSLRLRALEAISVFAYKLGIKLIAAFDDILVHAQQGRLQMGAAKDVHIFSAGGKTVVEASESLTLRVSGSELTLDSGGVHIKTQGSYEIHAGGFSFTGPAGANPSFDPSPSSSLASDEKFVLRYRGSGLPVKNLPYALKLDDGSTMQGVTDAQGQTQLVARKALQIVDLVLLPKKASGASSNTAATPSPNLSGDYDQHFVVTDEATGQPLADFPYTLTLESGQKIEGRTDEEGKTQKISSSQAETATLEVFEEVPPLNPGWDR